MTGGQDGGKRPDEKQGVVGNRDFDAEKVGIGVANPGLV